MRLAPSRSTFVTNSRWVGSVDRVDVVAMNFGWFSTPSVRTTSDFDVESVGQVPLDVRFVAASNRDLRRKVQRGAFREGLFCRLNVVNVHLPELKDRAEDTPLLAEHFLRRFAAENRRSVHGISREARSPLQSSLETFASCAIRSSRPFSRAWRRADRRGLRPPGGWVAASAQPATRNRFGIARRNEPALHPGVLSQTVGQLGLTAQILGIDRRTLYTRIRKYGLGNHCQERSNPVPGWGGK